MGEAKKARLGLYVVKSKVAFLSRVDKLKKEIGPIKKSTAELVKEGRRK